MIFIEILMKLDRYSFFSTEVDLRETFYYQLIKKPIFLSTMYSKASSGEYNEDTTNKLKADLEQLY